MILPIHSFALALLAFYNISHSLSHSLAFSLAFSYIYIYIICQCYIFNRYTHSHIKYRGKYIDKVLVYRSHVVDSDPAKTPSPNVVSLFTDRPFAMHPIVPIGKLSESTS